MIKKMGIVIIYIIGAVALFVLHEPLLMWIQSTSPSVLVVILFATVIAFFPLIPYGLVGGVIGVLFGPWLGGLVTWMSSIIASLLFFLVVRYGYQDWGYRVLFQSYKPIHRLADQFERHAFIAILFARILPIVPSVAVNLFSALSRVPFQTYALASALGKLPAMLLYSLVGSSLWSNEEGWTLPSLIVVGYVVFLAITVYLYKLWKRE
jgi:uncharacterized membrane protein YdjX (TVP38/TMEM64 family)